MGPSTDTMFENHPKSLIQHCERSELRLHFVWQQHLGFQKLAKWDQIWHFKWTFVHSKCKRSSVARNVEWDFFCDFQTLRYFAAFCAILRHFVKFCGILWNFPARHFTAFIGICGILRNFVEFSGAVFCGISRNFSEFYGILRNFVEFSGIFRNFTKIRLQCWMRLFLWFSNTVIEKVPSKFHLKKP